MSSTPKPHTQKLDKTASQNSSMSGTPHVKDRKGHKRNDSGLDNSADNTGTRSKSPVPAIKGKRDDHEKSKRSAPTIGGSATPTTEKTEKGILKTKKNRKAQDPKKPVAKPKAKVKPHKKSFFEKLAFSCGFYVGDVTLTDPWAIEAVQALDLQQWHLRRLKMRFDKIDLDSSGNIDYDEFFESIGEMRSPFTDKLFALIGNCFAHH
jgi:hypothetical protein